MREGHTRPPPFPSRVRPSGLRSDSEVTFLFSSQTSLEAMRPGCLALRLCLSRHVYIFIRPPPYPLSHQQAALIPVCSFTTLHQTRTVSPSPARSLPSRRAQCTESWATWRRSQADRASSKLASSFLYPSPGYVGLDQ